MAGEHAMSSAHSGPDGHLDPLMLAEHAEGLLPPEQAGGVDHHLRACAACRGVADALTAVSVRLAAEPRELAVPPAVADRIATALAGEQRADRPAVRAPVVSLDSWTSRLRRRAPALLAAAATVSAVGFAVYAINSDILGDQPTDDSLAETTAEDSADAAEPEAADDSDDEAAPFDQEAESGAGADDAPAEDTGDGAAGDSLEEQGGALTLDDAEFMAEIQEVASGRASGPSPARVSDGCGANLADELDREVVGAATTDLVEPGSVLVVVTTDDPDSVEGWVLPTCDDGPDDALTSQETPRR